MSEVRRRPYFKKGCFYPTDHLESLKQKARMQWVWESDTALDESAGGVDNE